MAVRGRLRSRCAVPLLQSLSVLWPKAARPASRPRVGAAFFAHGIPPPRRGLHPARQKKGGGTSSLGQTKDTSSLGKGGTSPRSEKRRPARKNGGHPNARKGANAQTLGKYRPISAQRASVSAQRPARRGGGNDPPRGRCVSNARTAEPPAPTRRGGAKAEGGASARSRREARKRSRSSASDSRVSGWRARCTRRSGADGTHGEVSGASSASDSRVSGWRARCRAANDASAASGMPEGRTDGTDGNGDNGNGTNRERRNVPTIRRQNGNAGGKTQNGGGGSQNAGGKTRNTGGRTRNTGGRTRNTGGERANVPRIGGGRNIGTVNIIANITIIVIMRRAAGLRQHVRCLLASACSTKSAQSAKHEERSRSSASDSRLRLARALRAAERRGRHARWSERRKQRK